MLIWTTALYVIIGTVAGFAAGLMWGKRLGSRWVVDNIDTLATEAAGLAKAKLFAEFERDTPEADAYMVGFNDGVEMSVPRICLDCGSEWISKCPHVAWNGTGQAVMETASKNCKRRIVMNNKAVGEIKPVNPLDQRNRG